MSIPIRELQTRFLWPFEFRARAVSEASSALRAATFESSAIWHRCETPRAYGDEYLAHVRDFLFERSASECEHLVVDAALGERWFADCELDHGRAVWRLVRLVPGPSIELFLTPHGTGVLCLTLAPTTRGLDAASALDFNYRLAQQGGRRALVLRKRHPAHDPAVLERIPREQRGGIEPIPDPEAPLAQRLVSRGGEFALRELIDLLLAPLRAFGARAVQDELCVYTVARLAAAPESASNAPLDLSDDAARPEVAQLLSGLAQVEESGHAGAPPGIVTTDHALLNRLHRVAASTLGAAHALADQGDVSFDEQRLANVRDKYFPAYLVALLQKVALNAAIRRAGEVSRAAPIAGADETAHTRALDELHRDLIDFSVRGNEVDVSSRNAVQRFYELAREGLRVPRSWHEVRAAIQDVDARQASRQQARIAQQQAGLAQRSEQHLDSIQRVQHVVHVVEYVLVPVYLVHLFHMLELHDYPLFDPLHHGGAVVAVVAGVALVWFLNRRSERSIRDGH